MNNIEFSISYKGYGYHVVYGNYTNGHFIALPYWEVACDASNPGNTSYNQDKLVNALTHLKCRFTSNYLQDLSRLIVLTIKEIVEDNPIED